MQGRKVDVDTEGSAADVVNRLDDAERAAVVDVGDDHCGTVGGQCQRALSPEPAAGSGDDRDLAVEVSADGRSYSWTGSEVRCVVSIPAQNADHVATSSGRFAGPAGGLQPFIPTACG